jgi:two-component system response regulator FixJ
MLGSALHQRSTMTTHTPNDTPRPVDERSPSDSSLLSGNASLTAVTTLYLVNPSGGERRRLASVLETHGGAIREFTSAGDMLAHVGSGATGCLICDADLGGSSGLHLMAQLHATGIIMPTVMLISPGDVHGAVAAMKAGVGEVVMKPADPGELLHAVRSVIERSRTGVSQRESVGELLRLQSKLTSRELMVMRLICRGSSNKQAAAEMQLAVKTIEIHRANVMRKMGCKSFAQLVRQAVVLENTPTPLNHPIVVGGRR